MYQGDRQKGESGRQLLTAHTRTCVGKYRSREEKTKMARAEPEFLSIPKNLREIQVRSK